MDDYRGSDKTIGIIVVLVVLFAVFAGSWGRGGGYAHAGYDGGHGYGGRGGCCEPHYTATDRDTWMQHCDTNKQLGELKASNDLQFQALQAQMSANTTAELRDELNKSYMAGLAKDGQIYALQNQMWTAGQFQQVDNKLCALGFALEKKPNTPSFVIDGGFVKPMHGRNHGGNPCDSCCG